MRQNIVYSFVSGKVLTHHMPVDLMGTDISFKFDHQIYIEIYIESKSSYYCFANKTKNTTGEEFFAQYAPLAE